MDLWFCIRIPITIVIVLPNLFQNTVDPTIVLVVHVYNMIAHLTIWFVFKKSSRLHMCYVTKDETTVSSAVQEILGGPKIRKVSHVTRAMPPIDEVFIFWFSILYDQSACKI